MKKTAFLALFASALMTSTAFADDYVLTLKDKAFTPQTLEIPADKKVKIIVKNETAAAMEFESHDLKREKVIAAGKEATVTVGPLKAGEYKFFNEFDESATGSVVVK